MCVGPIGPQLPPRCYPLPHPLSLFLFVCRCAAHLCSARRRHLLGIRWPLPPDVSIAGFLLLGRHALLPPRDAAARRAATCGLKGAPASCCGPASVGDLASGSGPASPGAVAAARWRGRRR
ncbi:unnamed protein product [Urochloa humidicola]